MIGNNKMIVDGFDTSDMFIIRKVNRGFTGMYSNKTDLMRLTQRKITERTINVEVTLISTYGLNELKTMLNKSSTVRFVFSDDKDWYWDGILDTSKINSSYLGADISLEILVPDGIKHAINPKGPYTATQGADGRYSVTLVNEGNVNAPITMTATMNAENGYIGMYTDYGVTQIGNKEEDDTEEYTQATTILNTTNFSEFTRYTGTNPENAQKGNTGTASIVNEYGTNFFHLSNAGTNNGKWHGASYVYNFPADGTGHVGAKNVYCYFNAVFWASLMGQTAYLQVSFTDANNRFVMGYDIYKNDTKGNTALWVALAGDGSGGIKVLKTNAFHTSHLDKDNPFNYPRGHSDIYKNGAKLRYYWFGSYPEFTVPELKDVEITKCYINFYQYGARSGNQLMRYFDLRRMMIRNDSAESIRDIKNRYQPETTVKMTGADSKVYVNGLPKLTEKVDGSNLFTIPPGETTIYFQCSDWCTMPPTYKIEFQEASL